MERVGVNVLAKGWWVDLSAETQLRNNRTLPNGVLEFFLIVFREACSTLELQLYLGTTALGKRTASAEPSD